MLSQLIRRILFVSPSMRALDLLLEMRLKRIHMALVVDEFGGIDGLVTIEDVVEQIVGEINDEHDTDPDPDLKQREDGLIEADARVMIDRFEDLVGPILSDEEREEVDTLGGLVFFVAGRVPARGEVIVHSTGFEFEILEADPRRVKRMRIKTPPAETRARLRLGGCQKQPSNIANIRICPVCGGGIWALGAAGGAMARCFCWGRCLPWPCPRWDWCPFC